MNNEISGKTLSSVTASIAAAIISDTPIVSIAGSTLSEITTTTTSTTTTPTPTPTPTNFDPSAKLQDHQHRHNNNKTLNNPMSDVAAVKTAGGIGTTATAIASTTASVPTDGCNNVGAGNIKNIEATSTAATVIGKTDDVNISLTTDTSKKSDILEDSCINQLTEPDLQKLLEEAYAYKTPKDKKNKSEIFLSLLQKVENEDRGITSNASDSHRQHPHSQHRHQQKQGGSLQDLVLLPTDYRRQTSRNKKVSSVSSRQREGGSLPSNVNVANCLLSSAFDQQQSVFGDKQNRRRTFLLGVDVATATQNLNLSANNNGVGTVAHNTVNCKDTNTAGAAISAAATGHNSVGASGGAVAAGAAANSGYSIGGSDYIINIGDCMMDIQQQQQILQSKTLDIASQGLAFYERVDIDRRIPRPSVHRTDSADFAPTRSHHYVDEAVRFHQIDAGASAGDDYVSDAISAVGSALKSAASCSLPMPLDEHYRSIKSVMGEKGENTQALKWTPVTNGSSSSSNSNSGSNSSTGFTFAKALTRQTDENGNDCDRQHSNSIYVSAGQSQAKAKTKKKLQKNNTKTVDLLNVAGYRGYDPVEELVKYIENTDDLTNKNAGGSGKFAESKKKERKKDKEKNSKMKKSNSLEELRSCAKIDVDDLKHSAATTENNNVTMRSKTSGGKGSKNNSASAADINKNFDSGNGKEITTTSTNGAKQATTTGAISAAITTTTTNNRKGERRSWGTEELQYLGESSTNNLTNTDDKKEKKTKGKEKEKEKERDIDKDKEKEKEREKDEGKEKIINNVDGAVDSEKSDKLEKPEKIETTEKLEKIEKSEKFDKRKKNDSVGQSATVNAIGQEQNIPTSATSEPAIVAEFDILAVDPLMPETAEFHVVTKKKKPKKQRISMDETGYYNNNNTSGFNRTHNFIFNTQKVSTSTPAFISQQQSNRYKSYNNHGHMFGTQVNSDSRMEYHNNASNGNHQYQSHYGHQQQHQPQQYHHQQQQNSVGHNNNSSGSGGTTIGDKSRRKSTSSVPPSEKSDSSDLDSVHSLPIESTTKNKQRHKNSQAAVATATEVQKNCGGSPAPISYADIAAAAAADRSWPSLEAANSHNSSSTSTNSNTNSLNLSLETQSAHVDSDLRTSAAIQNTVVAIVNNVTSAPTTTNNTKLVKNKKLASKPDFPELVATNAMVITGAGNGSGSIDPNPKSLNTTFKSITYSQSLTTTPTVLNTTVGSTFGNEATVTGAAMLSPSSGNDVKQEKRNIITTDANKGDCHYNNSVVAVTRLQQSQQQPQQQLQKSKSVENESYSYNSSNLDQQYPALEKTVKRHSATNVSLGCASNATGGTLVTPATHGNIANNNTSPSLLVTATQFNFAAAAKQQVNISAVPKAAVATFSQVGQSSAAAAVLTTVAPTSSTSNSNYAVQIAPSSIPIAAASTVPTASTTVIAARKSKEKSPTNVAVSVMNPNYTTNTNNVQALAANNIDGGNVMRKTKKEKQQQTLPYEFGTHVTLTNEQAPTNFAQKSTAATQTNSIPISGSDNSNNHNHVSNSGSDNDSHYNCVSSKPPRAAAIANTSNALHMSKNHKTNTATGSGTCSTGISASSTGVTNTGATNIASVAVTTANRPAVIILNDDRNDANAIGMEFTFGDFNEDELKFFDESIIEDDGGCSDELIDCYVAEHQSQSKSMATSVAYFNDSGVASDTSNANTNNAYTDTSTLAFGDNNLPHDSGTLSKSVKKNNNNVSSSVGNTERYIAGTLTQQSQKLNSFLSTPPTIANSNSNSNNEDNDNDNDNDNDSEQPTESYQHNDENSGCRLPQQLETCNDIETAIIAAARAAAAAEQQQQHQLPHSYRRKQHQASYAYTYEQPQQQQHNRQSTYTRDGTNHQHHHHQHHHPHQNQYQHYNQSQQQQKPHYNHSNSSNSASRSRSSSGNENINSNSSSYDLSSTPPPLTSPSSSNNANTNTMNIQRKELDIHFIPPTTSTAFSALQHNDIIVDFIGSAWEEVAKVAKFYDGQ